jgi:glycosyltransferase involved in cell wall biosynthesis
MLKGKTMLILSYWGYPFGGGEEYLYQTAIWGIKNQMRIYWISFSNPDNKIFDDFSVQNIEGFFIIKIPGGFSKNKLYSWIKLINPDAIHHQGHYRKQFYDVAAELRIPFITGIHFWSGIILLGDPGNKNILENIALHRIDPEYLELYGSQYCIFYSVSKFVTECIEKLTDKIPRYLAYAGSLTEKCLVPDNPDNNAIKNRYVTVINIHALKGGELILYLLEKLINIPFMIIRTEYQSDDLDKKIKDVVFQRNRSGHAECVFSERVSEIKQVFARTKIFLAPSIVDETFCRTVNEAMMNRIPVITSGNGNLRYLVEGAGVIIDTENKQEWADKITELYDNEQELKKIIDRTILKYSEYSENICEQMFLDILHDVVKTSKMNNIMIIAPWCDQGLGIQSRNYFNILKSNGYNVHIFSINPYGVKSTIELQKNPNEWIVDKIYYSKNDREHVQDTELLQFIRLYGIGKCIIPETCWFRIFEIAKLMRDNDVKCYAIPNIEIVRKDEIAKHKYFYKILANNRLCENIFRQHLITNVTYTGYGILDPEALGPAQDPGLFFRQKNIGDKIKFLFIGGMNAFSRKHILEICEGFRMAYDENCSIQLTCTIQKTNALEVNDVEMLLQYTDHPAITFIRNHLTYQEIIDLYHHHHISIQVSKHEGLGLGFYEALATGTPVISLNCPPHNEIIIDQVNGWLIDCQMQEMTDNPDSFIKSAYFDPLALKEKILAIIDSNIPVLIEKLHADYNARLSGDVFVKKFLMALDH